MTIGNCTLANNTNTSGAGAIYNSFGSLNVANSTFTGNTANGGGAFVNNTVSIVAGGPDPSVSSRFVNCTFSGNNGNSNVGGALFNLNGLMSIESCTIAGNSAAIGGVSRYSGSTTLTRVQNSIIADNRTVGGGPDSGIDVNFVAGDNVTNTFESGNHNAIGNGNATGNFNKTNDQTAVTAAALQLGALVNNGGLTQTRAGRGQQRTESRR